MGHQLEIVGATRLRVGFTGTRQGMTEKQLTTLCEILAAYADSCRSPEFHHGDCVGADDEADAVARGLGFSIVLHPPTRESGRAHCEARGVTSLWRPRPYVERDREIVEVTDVLVACPLQDVEVTRSGSWTTVRHARALGKTVRRILRDGTLVTEG